MIFYWIPLQMLIMLNFKEITSMTSNESNKSAGESSIVHIKNPSANESFSAHTMRDRLIHHHLTKREAKVGGHETISPSNTLAFNKDLTIRNSSYIGCNLSEHTFFDESYKGDPKAVIESKKTELRTQNNTNRDIFEKLTKEMRSFIEHDDKIAEQAVINMMEEYTQNQNNIMNEIKTLNAFIRKYKCTPGHDNETIYEVPEQEFKHQFLISENIIKEYKYLRNIINIYDSSELLIDEANNLTTNYNERHHISDLRHAVEKKRELNQKLEKIVQEIKLYRKFAQDSNQQEYFVNEFFDDLLNLEYWQNDLVNKTSELKDLEQYVEEESFRVVLQEYVQPTFQGIIFIVGFVGNGVLLIFARHKDLLTAANMMLLNLAFADILNLVVNIVAFYTYFMSSEWTLGEGLCKAFRFFRHLCIGVCVYSVVVICIQRFLALTYLSSPRRYIFRLMKKFKTVLTIFLVWFIACMAAIPHTINAGIYEGNCYGASEEHTNYPKAITIFDFLAFFIIPFIIISCLSTISALKLRQSVGNMPGGKDGMEELMHARVISSNILIALTIVFAVSYFPFHLFMLIIAWSGYDVDTSVYHTMFFITYTLLFANSCFNPIAVYIASKKFRNYFNTYLFCKREIRDEQQNQTLTKTSSSNVETRM